MEGETSSIECAHQLGALCEGRHLVVNLIPYNATDVKDKLQCPSVEHMQKFRDIVASYGAFCTIRRTMGADIAGACGQLVKKNKEEEGNSVDIEDVVPSLPRENREDTKPASPASAGSSTHGERPSDNSGTSTPSPFSASWLQSLSSSELESWLKIMTAGAAISASCFLVSGILTMKRR